MPATKKCFRMTEESKPCSAGPMPGAVPPPPPRGEGGRRKEGEEVDEVDEGGRGVARARRVKGRRGRRCSGVEEDDGAREEEGERKAVVSREVGLVAGVVVAWTAAPIRRRRRQTKRRPRRCCGCGRRGGLDMMLGCLSRCLLCDDDTTTKAWSVMSVCMNECALVASSLSLSLYPTRVCTREPKSPAASSLLGSQRWCTGRQEMR